MLSRFQFQNDIRSYTLVVVLGLLAGVITRLSDYLPGDTLWSFSSIASAFGFWMVTTTFVIYYSSSNRNAFLNVLLYLSSMNFIFYTGQFLLGLHIDRFHVEGVNWGLLLLYDVIALAAAVISYMLYYWNSKGVVGSMLYALPLAGLGSETLGLMVFLARTHTYLFQLLFDSISFVLIGILFYKKSNHKVIYISTVIMGVTTGYILYYSRMV